MRFFGLILVSVFMLAGCVTGETVTRGDVKVTYTGSPPKILDDIFARTEHAVKSMSEYWGSGSNRSVWIRMTGGRIGAARHDSGYVILPDISSNPGSTILEHEVAHLVTGRPGSNSLMLSEGIAVYLEKKFPLGLDGENKEDDDGVHAPVAAAIFSSEFLPAHRLDSSIRNRSGSGVHTDDRDVQLRIFRAYRASGSFVKFLIERYGLSKFKTLYKGASFTSVYGKDLFQLNDEWVELLKQVEPISKVASLIGRTDAATAARYAGRWIGAFVTGRELDIGIGQLVPGKGVPVTFKALPRPPGRPNVWESQTLAATEKDTLIFVLRGGSKVTLELQGTGQIRGEWSHGHRTNVMILRKSAS